MDSSIIGSTASTSRCPCALTPQATSTAMIILGATGSGKTYLSCAFGMEACKQGFTVRYVRLPELLEELAIARGEGCFKKAITQLKKVQLLIIDEWMLISLTETEARDLLELIHG